jgi:hypothetical protein
MELLGPTKRLLIMWLIGLRFALIEAYVSTRPDSASACLDTQDMRANEVSLCEVLILCLT